MFSEGITSVCGGERETEIERHTEGVGEGRGKAERG